MSTIALLTTAGTEWNARVNNGETVSPITKIAFGDGDRVPTVSVTALENQVHEATVGEKGTTGSVSWFRAFLPPGVGGFEIREAGLFTQDGTLIAVVRRDVPVAIGVQDDLQYTFNVIFAYSDAVPVTLDPSIGVTDNRRIDTADGTSGGGDLSVNRTIRTDWSNLGEAPIIGDDDTFNIRHLGQQLRLSFAMLRGYILSGLQWATDAQFADPTTMGKIPQVRQIHEWLVKIATLAEVDAGTVADKAVAPNTAKQVYLPKLVDGTGTDENGIGVLPVAVNTLFFKDDANAIGAVEIAFDLTKFTGSTWVSFDLHIATHTTALADTIRIQGHMLRDSNPQWTEVKTVSGETNFTVRFTFDEANDRAYIYVAELDTTWSYPRFHLSDFVVAGASGETLAWRDDVVSIALQDTAFLGQEEGDPVVGGSPVVARYGKMNTNNVWTPKFSDATQYPDASLLQDGDLATSVPLTAPSSGTNIIYWMAQFDNPTLVTRVEIYPASNWTGIHLAGPQFLIADDGDQFRAATASEIVSGNDYAGGTQNPVIVEFAEGLQIRAFALCQNAVNGYEPQTDLTEFKFY